MGIDRSRNQKSRNELKRRAKVLERIITNNDFISAAVEAHNSVESRSRFSANERAYFREHRSDIPDEVAVEFTDGTPPILRLTINGEGIQAGVKLYPSDEPPNTDPRLIARYRNKVKETVGLTVSDVLLDAVEEAFSDEQFRQDFSADPTAHLQKRGLSIPTEAEIKVTVKAGSRLICWAIATCYMCSCWYLWHCWSDEHEGLWTWIDD